MQNRVFIFLLLGFFASLSCKKKDEVCFEEFTFRITTADVPSLAAVGDTIPIIINYKLYTVCQKLNSVTHTVDGSDVEFSLKGQEDGCECEAQETEKSTEYPISFPTSGTYYLKFVQETGFYRIDTLVVS